MMLTVLAIFSLACAAIPAMMFMANRKLFVVPTSLEPEDSSDREQVDSVSVLIPARNEASGIEAAVRSILASKRVTVEVIVLDDNSDDRTAEIVSDIASTDPRVYLVKGVSLPSGWNGKQHACYQLSKAAHYSHFVFIDADVRLQSDALARFLKYHEKSQVALLSVFPHQETETWLEKWMIPLMHFILLGFLPMKRMRQSVSPAYAAGCGQLFLTSRNHYEQAGTHAAIRESRHDGLKLPRAYRMAGLATDCIDGTGLADCRMYRSAKEVVRGLLKNAIEGLANPKLIPIFTVLLLGGSVLPLGTMIASLSSQRWGTALISGLAIVLFHLPRLLAAIQFRQSFLGVLCHLPSVVFFVFLQWLALLNHVSGRRTPWRGRLG